MPKSCYCQSTMSTIQMDCHGRAFSHLDNKNTEIAFNLISQRCLDTSLGMILTSLDKSHITHFNKELFL